MVFERKVSCQHVDVKMRMLQFFPVEKSGIISRWNQSVSDQDFHTCLFFMYNTLLLYADGQQLPKWLGCEAPVLEPNDCQMLQWASCLLKIWSEFRTIALHISDAGLNIMNWSWARVLCRTLLFLTAFCICFLLGILEPGRWQTQVATGGQLCSQCCLL